MTRMTVQERFWSKVVQHQAGCWEWTGTITASGYGRFDVGRKKVLAHRISYEKLVGPIEEGLTLDHLCRNKACVKPAHLEPVPLLLNVQRGIKATLTHCLRGHPLSGDNLLRRPGHRTCRECCRIREAERKARRAPALLNT